MEDLVQWEAKYVVIKIDEKGNPVGVLTHKTSRYGSNTAVSSFNLSSLATAVTSNDFRILENTLYDFLNKKKTYKYDDFRIVEMETKTTVSFGKEITVSKEKENLINNNKKLVEMAKEWGKQWKKDNPNENPILWSDSGNPRINPLASQYYETKLAELNWERGKDYDWIFGGSKALNAFIENIS